MSDEVTHCNFRDEIKLHMRETAESLKTLSIEAAKSTIIQENTNAAILKIEKNDKLQWQRLDEHQTQISILRGKLTNTWFGLAIAAFLAGVKAYMGGR